MTGHWLLTVANTAAWLTFPLSSAEAVRWYRLAADQGFADTQALLCLMYSEGSGVPQNYVEAYKWPIFAAARGDNLMVAFRESITAEMTPAQIAEGQRLAAAWRPR